MALDSWKHTFILHKGKKIYLHREENDKALLDERTQETSVFKTEKTG